MGGYEQAYLLYWEQWYTKHGMQMSVAELACVLCSIDAVLRDLRCGRIPSKHWWPEMGQVAACN